jgi:phosphatidylserine/phosphatidylglycerophosphate/cardiolipin synthase-like enzyme
MRRKQWFVSVVLFGGSLCFLIYSKYFFSQQFVSESALTLPVLSTPQSNIVLLANDQYYPFLKEHIRKAQKSIVGTVYLFKTAPFRDNEPADLVRELGSARKRGVSVELIMDVSSEDRDSNDANLRAAEMLNKAGVTVWFDHAEVTTHAKVLVIDDQYCFVGSHNFTHSAMAVNKELTLFVDSLETAKQIREFISQIPRSPYDEKADRKIRGDEFEETRKAKSAER